MEKNVLGIFAHPDDAEILCAGTLSLLSKTGWTVHIATVATGDKGTTVYARDELIRIRNAEARKAAGLIGGTYQCCCFID